MKRLIALFPLSFVACTGSPMTSGTPDMTIADDMAMTEQPLTFEGGMFALGGACGYSVTTRANASPPIAARPQLGPDPTPFAIHLGIASDPARSMVVSWRTRDEQTLATRVQFGTGGKTDQSLDGVTFAYQNQNGNLPPVRIHETHLCGLVPDTVYSYRVGGKDPGGAEKWSDVYTFRTAPDAAADAQVTVVALGDTRNDPAEWGRVLAKAEATAKPDVIFFSGDSILLGFAQADWDTWFDVVKDVLVRVPIVTAHGNHEANAINYYAQFALPGNEEYYGLDYGPVHLTVLNDTPVDSGSIAGAQKTFLTQDLASTMTRPWHFVMHHKPLYSIDMTHGGEANLLATWGPIYDQFKVDLVLNGHVHGYERTNPIRANLPQATPAEGTLYVVSGGGGAPLYDFAASDPSNRVKVAVKTNNFTVIQVRPHMLQMAAYKDDATMLDSLTITK